MSEQMIVMLVNLALQALRAANISKKLLEEKLANGQPITLVEIRAENAADDAAREQILAQARDNGV